MTCKVLKKSDKMKMTLILVEALRREGAEVRKSFVVCDSFTDDGRGYISRSDQYGPPKDYVPGSKTDSEADDYELSLNILHRMGCETITRRKTYNTETKRLKYGPEPKGSDIFLNLLNVGWSDKNPSPDGTIGILHEEQIWVKLDKDKAIKGLVLGFFA
jgi:hypothetical protein